MEDEDAPAQVEKRVLARLEAVLQEELEQFRDMAAAVDARAAALADRENHMKHRARVIDDEFAALDAVRASTIDEIDRMQRAATARDIASRQRAADIARREAAAAAKELEAAAAARDLERALAENRRLAARLADLEAWLADQTKDRQKDERA
jgi:hypothetical protein